MEWATEPGRRGAGTHESCKRRAPPEKLNPIPFKHTIIYWLFFYITRTKLENKLKTADHRRILAARRRQAFTYYCIVISTKNGANTFSTWTYLLSLPV